ncbi:hypothetical protein R3P38DRAFT_3245194 [Favolaschia claudopus]|uniref:Uncharacterized protein n=1 Tax=Favolaschia claudopus TaxID=2862362 RepID=A0AAV9Z0V2_9AGAR
MSLPLHIKFSTTLRCLTLPIHAFLFTPSQLWLCPHLAAHFPSVPPLSRRLHLRTLRDAFMGMHGCFTCAYYPPSLPVAGGRGWPGEGGDIEYRREAGVDARTFTVPVDMLIALDTGRSISPDTRIVMQARNASGGVPIGADLGGGCWGRGGAGGECFKDSLKRGSRESMGPISFASTTTTGTQMRAGTSGVWAGYDEEYARLEVKWGHKVWVAPPHFAALSDHSYTHHHRCQAGPRLDLLHGFRVKRRFGYTRSLSPPMSATTQTSPRSPARSLEEQTPLSEIPGHLGKDDNPNRLAPTPLADGLKASLLGRPSNTRSITRTSTAPAIIPRPPRHGRASHTAPNPSSVGAPELEDELVGRLEEVELKLSNVSDVTDAHERSLSDLIDKLDVPFALSHLRDATQEQFAKARKERQELAERVESDYKNQRRDKRDYDEKMAGIRADVDQIKAALARLELAVIPPPLPPRVPSPTRRVSPLPRRALSSSRPRSRSPQPGFKRSRPATADSGDIDFGPVSRDLTDHLSARSVFELHLATALPQHPALGAFEIERKDDVLRISGLPSGVATALVRAWGDHSVEGYKFNMLCMPVPGLQWGDLAQIVGGRRRDDEIGLHFTYNAGAAGEFFFFRV